MFAYVSGCLGDLSSAAASVNSPPHPGTPGTCDQVMRKPESELEKSEWKTTEATRPLLVSGAGAVVLQKRPRRCLRREGENEKHNYFKNASNEIKSFFSPSLAIDIENTASTTHYGSFEEKNNDLIHLLGGLLVCSIPDLDVVEAAVLKRKTITIVPSRALGYILSKVLPCASLS